MAKKALGIQEIREKEKWLRNLTELFKEFELRLGDMMVVAPSKKKVTYGHTFFTCKWLTVVFGRKITRLQFRITDVFLKELYELVGIDDPEKFEEYMREKTVEVRMGETNI